MDNYNENKKEFLRKIRGLKPDNFMEYLYYCKRYNQDITVQKLKDFGFSENYLNYLENNKTIILQVTKKELEIRKKEKKPSRMYFDNYILNDGIYDEIEKEVSKQKQNTSFKKNSKDVDLF